MDDIYSDFHFAYAMIGVVPKRGEKQGDVHPWPCGCEWFRDCGKCRWADCVTNAADPIRYDSKEGVIQRGRELLRRLCGGEAIEDAAGFFAIGTGEAAELTVLALPFGPLSGEPKPLAELPDGQCRAQLQTTYDRQERALGMRASGLTVYQIAKELGVSHTSVSYYCRGVDFPPVKAPHRKASA
jgi:hypothetical protein